jgi:hypothetical protein
VVDDVHLRKSPTEPSAATVMQPALERTLISKDASASLPLRIFRNLALQDWIVAIYLSILVLAIATGDGGNRESCYRMVAFDAAILVVNVVLVRGELVKGVLGSLLYRLCAFLPVFLSYFQLRWILPTVTTRSLDAQIYAFDMRVFGYEPSVAWDKFVNPTTTEWFAFFYFGYFFILMLHVLPFIFGAADTKTLRHWALGMFFQFCITHTLYMVVPGWGPYHELKFDHELTGGTFWGWVVSSVHAGGALKDIFPSLHTGAPTFFAVFAFLHRKQKPFKYYWIPLAFCVSQIICATMFLRWHYLVDIVAGFTLGTANAFASRAIVEWEAKRRQETGAMAVFGEAPINGLVWLLGRFSR